LRKSYSRNWAWTGTIAAIKKQNMLVSRLASTSRHSPRSLYSILARSMVSNLHTLSLCLFDFRGSPLKKPSSLPPRGQRLVHSTVLLKVSPLRNSALLLSNMRSTKPKSTQRLLKKSTLAMSFKPVLANLPHARLHLGLV
jgi:hypothetical protein